MPGIVHGQGPDQVHHQDPSRKSDDHHNHHPVTHHIFNDLHIFLRNIQRGVIGQNACILFYVLNDIVDKHAAAHRHDACQASG